MNCFFPENEEEENKLYKIPASVRLNLNQHKVNNDGRKTNSEIEFCLFTSLLVASLLVFVFMKLFDFCPHIGEYNRWLYDVSTRGVCNYSLYRETGYKETIRIQQIFIEEQKTEENYHSK